MITWIHGLYDHMETGSIKTYSTSSGEEDDVERHIIS